LIATEVEAPRRSRSLATTRKLGRKTDSRI
jgi:hypothetical protein